MCREKKIEIFLLDWAIDYCLHSEESFLFAFRYLIFVVKKTVDILSETIN